MVDGFSTTLMITVVSVSVELVLGFGFAFVMYRILHGRGLVRTGILVPYGIITVVSAYIWRYAFQLDSGFINQWFGLGDFNWFGARWSAMFVIIWSEIWKTTPFISCCCSPAGAGAVEFAGGGVGGWRVGAPAAHAGHVAEHEGRDHGRVVVQDLGCLADLR